MRPYLAAIGLVVIVTAGIGTWQLLFVPEPPPASVKVDGNERAPALARDPGILTREADRAAQAQIERVEAAKRPDGVEDSVDLLGLPGGRPWPSLLPFWKRCMRILLAMYALRPI